MHQKCALVCTESTNFRPKVVMRWRVTLVPLKFHVQISAAYYHVIDWYLWDDMEIKAEMCPGKPVRMVHSVVLVCLVLQDRDFKGRFALRFKTKGSIIWAILLIKFKLLAKESTLGCMRMWGGPNVAPLSCQILLVQLKKILHPIWEIEKSSLGPILSPQVRSMWRVFWTPPLLDLDPNMNSPLIMSDQPCSANIRMVF